MKTKESKPLGSVVSDLCEARVAPTRSVHVSLLHTAFLGDTKIQEGADY